MLLSNYLLAYHNYLCFSSVTLLLWYNLICLLWQLHYLYLPLLIRCHIFPVILVKLFVCLSLNGCGFLISSFYSNSSHVASIYVSTVWWFLFGVHFLWYAGSNICFSVRAAFSLASLKLVSAIFNQVFIFSSIDSPLKTMKNVFYFI